MTHCCTLQFACRTRQRSTNGTAIGACACAARCLESLYVCVRAGDRLALVCPLAAVCCYAGYSEYYERSGARHRRHSLSRHQGTRAQPFIVTVLWPFGGFKYPTFFSNCMASIPAFARAHTKEVFDATAPQPQPTREDGRTSANQPADADERTHSTKPSQQTNTWAGPSIHPSFHPSIEVPHPSPSIEQEYELIVACPTCFHKQPG
jgi:hypothetical protein